ncbi:MAG TPA: glycoside hydrolase family 32 protein [Clostridiales bacterium]|nr:glycoside hydrolase family 32 protein [Clostridiales bacterium]
MTLRELYRPKYHFTPQKNWTNDPNGMFYYKGEYHLFFQHNPNDKVWGPMHWGHAVSTDLVHWEELPVALEPDSLGTIFSGCAVVDWENTSGFQTGQEKVIVAVFTQHEDDNEKQSIAYSNDRGRTWVKYKGNPVVKNPGIKDFRDPKVFWYAPSERWTMVLACHDRVRFYSSPDLKSWEYLSEFGQDHGAHGGVWECPDLFRLNIEGNPGEARWVLAVSVSNGAPNGGPGVQYFIGQFDGSTFTCENYESQALWVDYGRDFYAAVTWHHDPFGMERRILLAWANNWEYANCIPASSWRGAMSVPRELSLSRTKDGNIILVQKPVDEIMNLRKKVLISGRNLLIADNKPISITDIEDAAEIILKISVDDFKTEEFGLRILDDMGNFCSMTVDMESMKLTVDRNNTGVQFHDRYPGVFHAPICLNENELKLHIFIDSSLLEIFEGDGQVSFTNQFFLKGHVSQAELFALKGQVLYKTVEIYAL